jgi:hypothetical protein
MVPMLALGLPIMDTLLSMTRRLMRSILPQESNPTSMMGKLVGMFLPDRGHIHHKLIDMGLSHRNVVLLLYVVSCAFGLGAFAVTVTNNFIASLIVFTVAIASFIGVSQLRYKEMAVLRNGVLLPMYEWPLMNSTLFHGFLDVGFFIAAYLVAHSLALPAADAGGLDRPFLMSLGAVCGIQLLVFSIAGMYKGTFRQMGIGDMLKILKTVTIAVAATFVVLSLLPGKFESVNMTLVTLDFYFLVSFVVGTRISFLVLHYISRRGQRRGSKSVLIYGADAKGLLMVQRILNDDALDYHALGFLDDDPQMEGKRINGYPIFGGHWKLRGIVANMKVDEILISTDELKPEVLRRLSGIARSNGIVLRTLKMELKEFESPQKQVLIPISDHFAIAGK